MPPKVKITKEEIIDTAMDIVRKNNIKVCYFQFASAEKCAEQFAMDELGVKE